MNADELDATMDELLSANDSGWTISARDWFWLLSVQLLKLNIAKMQRAHDKLYQVHDDELDAEEQQYYSEGKRELNNIIYWAKEHLKSVLQELPPDLQFNNISKVEEKYARLANIDNFVSVDQMVRDACKKYNAGRDKVILQDYVVKEVLKKEKDPEKLRSSDDFLSHLLGAKLKTARRWGLSESEYYSMKEYARERLRA